MGFIITIIWEKIVGSFNDACYRPYELWMFDVVEGILLTNNEKVLRKPKSSFKKNTKKSPGTYPKRSPSNSL